MKQNIYVQSNWGTTDGQTDTLEGRLGADPSSSNGVDVQKSNLKSSEKSTSGLTSKLRGC